MRVLIVDDSRTARVLLRESLKDLKAEIFEAANGVEALDTLKKHDPIQLAFVDWIMPEMDGLAFVKAVRADRARDSLVLVMVTQQTHLSDVDQALKAGANEYLMKPFTPESLSEKLQILGLLPS
jgi:two-component system chemotaxis response regulator CheY